MLSHKDDIRLLTQADVPRGAALAKQIGWSQNEETWQKLIRWGGEGSFCIAQGDELLATAIAVAYNRDLAWIGVVIVHPDHRRKGLGERLMVKSLEYLKSRDVQCIMLDASEMGHPLYLKLGFRDLYAIETWAAEQPIESKLSPVRAMTEADVAEVAKLDAQIFGVERPQVISGLAVPGLSWVDDSSGEIDGYILSQPSNHGRRIGPWYHHTPEGAERLFTTLIGQPDQPPTRVQFPVPNDHARAIVERYGLKYINSMTRMVYSGEPPGDMTRQYSIAAAATG